MPIIWDCISLFEGTMKVLVWYGLLILIIKTPTLALIFDFSGSGLRVSF